MPRRCQGSTFENATSEANQDAVLILNFASEMMTVKKQILYKYTWAPALHTFGYTVWINFRDKDKTRGSKCRVVFKCKVMTASVHFRLENATRGKKKTKYVRDCNSHA